MSTPRTDRDRGPVQLGTLVTGAHRGITAFTPATAERVLGQPGKVDQVSVEAARGVASMGSGGGSGSAVAATAADCRAAL